MAMTDCPDCGGRVRLGANKIWVNRKHGVYNYIAHMDGTPMHTPDTWSCVAMKPCDKKIEDRPYSKLIERWEQHARAASPDEVD